MATTTLDNLISESGRRSGIGAAAEPLTRELLQLMTGGPGGLSAFLDRFRSAGMGNEVQSFIGGRSEAPLPPKAVDTVIGEDTVASIAKRVGVAPAAASTAFGFEIPRLIAMLTPGGKVSSAMPSEVQTFVGRSDNIRPAPTAVREDEQVRPVAMATLREAEPTKKKSLLWLWALVALAVIAGFLWTMFSRNRAVAPPAPAPAVETVPAPAPAPVAEAPPAPAVAAAVGELNQNLSGAVLNFPTGSASLPAASLPRLSEEAARIKSLPAGTVIEIGGHTDNTGNPTANMALSQHRADAVRNALVQDGVDPTMLTARGFGETKPVASNDTADGRLQNRRTEFTVASR